MIYTWKCKTCGATVDVWRRIINSSVPPLGEEAHHEDPRYPGEGRTHDVEWARVYNSSTPYKTLAHNGVFMDDNGNYAPRNTS